MHTPKLSWLDIDHCLNCGSTTWKNGYSDYIEHTLTESETLCGNCGKPIHVFAYGFEEHYTFTIRDLLNNLKL